MYYNAEEIVEQAGTMPLSNDRIHRLLTAQALLGTITTISASFYTETAIPNNPVLVTGGVGFIGSSTTTHLAANNDTATSKPTV